jgi:hypothetical protein
MAFAIFFKVKPRFVGSFRQCSARLKQSIGEPVCAFCRKLNSWTRFNYYVPPSIQCVNVYKKYFLNRAFCSAYITYISVNIFESG